MEKDISSEFADAKDEFGSRLSEITPNEFIYSGEDPDVVIMIKLPDDYPQSPPQVLADGNDITSIVFTDWMPLYTLTDILTLALKYHETDKLCSSLSREDYDVIDKEVRKGVTQNESSVQKLIQSLPCMLMKQRSLEETAAEANKSQAMLPELKQKLQEKMKRYDEKLMDIKTLRNESKSLEDAHAELTRSLGQKLVSLLEERKHHEEALANLKTEIGTMTPEQYVNLRSEHRRKASYSQMVIDFIQKYVM